MNPVAEKLGELGLPRPVSELAARDWDVVIVGAGHNGLTAAAYLAREGKSVLVLGASRAGRRRLHARAAVLRRALHRQPLRLRRRRARRPRDLRARPARARRRDHRRRPGPLHSVRRRHRVRRVRRRGARRSRAFATSASPRRTSRASTTTARRSTAPAASSARASGTPGSATSPSRAELEEMLGEHELDRSRLRGLDLGRARRARRGSADQGRALRPGPDRRLWRAQGQGHGDDPPDAPHGRART